MLGWNGNHPKIPEFSLGREVANHLHFHSVRPKNEKQLCLCSHQKLSLIGESAISQETYISSFKRALMNASPGCMQTEQLMLYYLRGVTQRGMTAQFIQHRRQHKYLFDPWNLL